MGQHKNSSLASIVKEKRTIFECNWDNLLVSSKGKITVGASSHDYADHDPNSHHGLRPGVISTLSASSMHSLRKSKKGAASPVLELPHNGVSGTPYDGVEANTATSFLLHEGNYELPFSVSLPPDIAETVEGLQAGSVLYKFESQLERGGFKNAFTKFKYLRIFRTLSPDNLAVQEEMYVGKSWPERLQYEISIPSKAIPVGGVTPVTVRLYPFQKGYKLNKISASLIQYYAFKDQHGQMYDDESQVFQQVMSEFDDVNGCDTTAGNLLHDKVEINSSIKLPSSLKKLTQDCDINNDCIRVRHKLRISISMKREYKDAETGETKDKNTEIKANIPVLVYISPHVPVEGRLVLLDNAGKYHFRPNELVPLFERLGQVNTSSSVSLNNLQRMSNGTFSVRYFPEEDLEAPPTYAKHVYDRLYDDNATSDGEASAPGSVPASPPTSAPASPWLRPSIGTPLDSFLDTPRNLSLDNLNRVPSYEQTVDDDEDEPGLPVGDLAPAYEPSSSPSRVATPEPHVQRPVALHKRPNSFHGGLAQFVRSKTPEIRSSSHHDIAGSKMLNRISSSNLQSLYGLNRFPESATHSSSNQASSSSSSAGLLKAKPRRGRNVPRDSTNSDGA